MSWLARFWSQPCKPYRNFQIAYAVLTLNFVLPALSYTFTPDQALEGFFAVNSLLGGGAYPFNEAESWLWRNLAAANVMTLGVMCGLLQYNLRYFWPVLVPLVVLKMYAALSFGASFLIHPEVPLFLAGFMLDATSSAAFVYFAARARDAARAYAPEQLVPVMGGAAP